MRPQPEPVSFDSIVRQPGEQWLKEKGISAPAPPKLKWKSLWTKSLKDLHGSYGGICAYAGIYIELVTGARTVEHFKPKKLYPSLAFDWDNYRLVCTALNSRKGEFEDVLDPFLLNPETFYLELASGKIYPNPALSAAEARAAWATIARLRLDDAECRRMRTSRFDEFLSKHIDEDFLRRRSPFIWQEAKRQGLI